MNKIDDSDSVPLPQEREVNEFGLRLQPSAYYYNRFRSELNNWVAKTNAHEHSDGIYISSAFLRVENLSDIPREHQGLFQCALACTILIDQTMYTHFKVDYPRFLKMTRYPKIEAGITGYHLHPWYIIHDVDRVEFRGFVEFFISDLKEFFKEMKFDCATWDNVRSAMLADKDIVSRYPGHVVGEILEKIK